MIVKAVREGLGRIIVLVDFLTRPKKLQRGAPAQAQVDTALASMSLYQFYACPFCVRTRRALHRLNLPIELRDAQHDQQHRQDLLEQGGAIKVPCLRIDEGSQSRWLYESPAIIAYLEERFAQVTPAQTQTPG